jgi:hypothetical protein
MLLRTEMVEDNGSDLVKSDIEESEQNNTISYRVGDTNQTPNPIDNTFDTQLPNDVYKFRQFARRQVSNQSKKSKTMTSANMV